MKHLFRLNGFVWNSIWEKRNFNNMSIYDLRDAA